jgi:hypothetical protein
MLGVAIGQGNGMPLLMQPGGQVNGQCRFADTAFGISDYDNHAPNDTTLAVMLASNMCIMLSGQHDNMMACKPASQLSANRESNLARQHLSFSIASVSSGHIWKAMSVDQKTMSVLFSEADFSST